MTRQQQWKNLDNFRRKLAIKMELRRNLLLSITSATSIPLIQRYNAQFNLSHILKRSSRNKIRNRCTISGRT